MTPTEKLIAAIGPWLDGARLQMNQERLETYRACLQADNAETNATPVVVRGRPRACGSRNENLSFAQHSIFGGTAHKGMNSADRRAGR